MPSSSYWNGWSDGTRFLINALTYNGSTGIYCFDALGVVKNDAQDRLGSRFAIANDDQRNDKGDGYTNSDDRQWKCTDHICNNDENRLRYHVISNVGKSFGNFGNSVIIIIIVVVFIITADEQCIDNEQ